MNGWLDRGLPSEITIPLTRPLTGASGFAKLDTKSLRAFLGDSAIAHESV